VGSGLNISIKYKDYIGYNNIMSLSFGGTSTNHKKDA